MSSASRPRVWLVGDTIPESVLALSERGGLHRWHPGDRVRLVHGHQVEVLLPDWGAEVRGEVRRRG